MNNYPVLVSRHRVPLILTHKFLGVMIGRGLTWTPDVAYVRKNLVASVNRARFMSGPTWKSRVRARLRRYQALFKRILWNSLPVINGGSKADLKSLQSLQAPLRACLGLPKCMSTTGAIAEARAIPIPVCQPSSGNHSYAIW